VIGGGDIGVRHRGVLLLPNRFLADFSGYIYQSTIPQDGIIRTVVYHARHERKHPRYVPALHTGIVNSSYRRDLHRPSPAATDHWSRPRYLTATQLHLVFRDSTLARNMNVSTSSGPFSNVRVRNIIVIFSNVSTLKFDTHPTALEGYRYLFSNNFIMFLNIRIIHKITLNNHTFCAKWQSVLFFKT
jgi:hypothetical protein